MPIGPRSFRSSLVIRAFVIVLAALGVFAASAYQFIVAPTTKQIAMAQMGQTAEQIDGNLSRLLGTVEITLRSSRHWGLTGVISQDDAIGFKNLFISVIGNHPEISSVIFTHESGREIFLLHTDDGRWLNRLTNPAQWGNKAYWLTWGADGQLESVSMKETDYDGRKRPWFKGAMALTDDSTLHWTSRYIFFTTREPGITAAARWTAADGSRYVIAHDVNLLDLSRFTSQVTAGRSGFAAIFQPDGTLIGLPRDERFGSDEAIKTAMHKSLDELDLPLLSEGLTRWQAGGKLGGALEDFDFRGQRWLSLFRPLSLGDKTFWLGVWAPQADFTPGSTGDALLAVLLAIATLALATFIVLPIARRLAAPLEALAQASARIGRMELDTPIAVESPWREVSALAGAEETMRQALLRATDDLRRANDTLEAKVAKRTHQLEQALESARAAEAAMKSAIDEQNAVFHSAGLGITVVRNRHFMRLNRRLAEMLGYTVEEMEGQSTRMLFDRQEDYEQLGKEGYETIYRGETYQGEYRMRRKDGSTFWCRESGRAIDLSSREAGSVWVLDDVTAEREAKRLIEETEAWYRAILESAPVGLLVVDEHGMVILANRQIERLFGYAAAEIIGQRSSMLLAPDTYEATVTEIQRRLADKSRESWKRPMQVPGRRKDGSGFPMEAELAYLPPREGQPQQLAVMIIDVTLRQQQQEALRHAVTLAEEAARMKSDFLANMSHEIRTPMNAIIGMSHLMLQTELAERQRGYMAKIRQSAQHLLGIINDILDFSKIEAGKLNVEHIAFSLDGVLENVANLVGDKAATKGLELIFDVHRDVPRQLIGDPLRLGQILINYANNAVKFTEHGEIAVVVRTESETENEVTLRLSVRDTGVGISPDQQRQLFQSFSQGDTSTTRKYGGTGLGLAISAKLAEMMNGSVGVDSEPGRGSTFWVSVRLGKGQADTLQLVPDPDMRGRRVLIVDDNESARITLGDMLASMTFRVGTADSGTAALAEVRRADEAGEPYELAFLDWHMPDIDGIETARRIAQLDLSLRPRFVMVTAFGHEEVIRSAQEAGFHEVLIKPVTPSQLFDASLRALGGVGRERPAVAAHTGPTVDLGAIRGARLLLVEDNDLNQDVASELLKHAGLIVDIAGNGEEAVAKVAQNRYELVLMDVHMPVMDGIAATEAIRRAGHQLPIVAMTASVMQKDREQCLAAGMNDHLPKPIEPDDLWAMLLKWIAPADRPREPAADHIPVVAVAGEPQAALPTELPAEIAGLDIETGLRRVLGNRAMYRSHLQRFAAEQANVVVQIRQALADDDLDAARRLAHTLKSLCGNLGAHDLQGLAAAAERAIIDGSGSATVTAIEPALLRLEQPLAAMIHELTQQLTTAPAATEATSSPDRLADVHARLLELLADGDLEALELMAREAPLLRTAYGDRYERIENAIRNYDFPQALSEIQAVRE